MMPLFNYYEQSPHAHKKREKIEEGGPNLQTLSKLLKKSRVNFQIDIWVMGFLCINRKLAHNKSPSQSSKIFNLQWKSFMSIQIATVYEQFAKIVNVGSIIWHRLAKFAYFHQHAMINQITAKFIVHRSYQQQNRGARRWRPIDSIRLMVK